MHFHDGKLKYGTEQGEELAAFVAAIGTALESVGWRGVGSSVPRDRPSAAIELSAVARIWGPDRGWECRLAVLRSIPQTDRVSSMNVFFGHSAITSS
jgi:hypothetical protein